MNRRHINSQIPWLGLLFVGIMPSPLKRIYYRLQGAKIGKRVKIGMCSYVRGADICISDDAEIAPFTFINVKGKFHLGARSSIKSFTVIDTGEFVMGEDSVIREQVIIGGALTPRSSVIIGSRTKIYLNSFINTTESVVIEDEVCIGGSAYIFTHSSWQSQMDGFPCYFAPVTIKRGAWLAWRVFVMPNVTIGEYATIGAGSVVTKSIPDRTLATGVPAKPIKRNEEYIKRIDPDEQHAMLMQWFGEFSEYLNYMGWRVSLHADHDIANIFVHSGNKIPNNIIYYRVSEPPQVRAGDVIVSFNALGDDQREACTQQNIAWFDIAKRECNLCRTAQWSETRNYLLRYGLRFTVIYSN